MSTTRRLAAILAADVVGYSRLVGVNETDALARLGSLRRDIIEPNIAKHSGRLFKIMGDGFLAEFASAVQAVNCAIAIQTEAEQAATALDNLRKMRLRIGIHVGDVMVEDDDLMGDGVNIAARLESIATHGGISISRAVHDQVRDRVEVAFDDKGEIALKNIARPVQVFAVSGAKDASAKTLSNSQPILALPDKPSIAVLPFQNMSGDPEQEYFADGMVEDIITALSRFKSFFVIARNSCFAYKGRAVDIKQVGRELGVRYVLEGSVRKAGGRVRITGQLIEASTGAHLWADKFDGALEDVFSLQDGVTERVVGAIEPSIKRAEINRAHAKPTSNLDAYDCYLRALPPFYHNTREGSDAATEHLRLAITRDPGYALAKAFLAFNYVARWMHGWGPPDDRASAMELAQEAIAGDPDDSSVLRWAGHAFGFWGDYDRALAVLEKAARLNVNGSQVLNSLGWVKCFACVEPDEAIAHFERAIRLSPLDTEMGQMLTGIALAHLIAGRNREALVFAQRSIDEAPRFTTPHRAKIAALILLGRGQEAKTAAEVLLTYDPGFTIASRVPKYRDAAFQQKYYGSLKAAGLPE